jgi:hypothetical protein
MSEPRDQDDESDTPPGDDERAQADSLRAALDDASQRHEDAELARVLRAAWSPHDLPADEHRALVARAVSRPRSRVVRVSFGASAFVALAASVVLFLWTGTGPGTVSPVTQPVALSRSTQDLFRAAFPMTGGESARIDRIAMARAADLRDNEFAKWGVR